MGMTSNASVRPFLSISMLILKAETPSVCDNYTFKGQIPQSRLAFCEASVFKYRFEKQTLLNRTELAEKKFLLRTSRHSPNDHKYSNSTRKKLGIFNVEETTQNTENTTMIIFYNWNKIRESR
jgi:hypothetical protein